MIDNTQFKYTVAYHSWCLVYHFDFRSDFLFANLKELW